MSSLFEWFKSRNEETAINKTLIHTQKVLECIVEYEKALSFLIEEHNLDLALKVFHRVDELEHQADGIRRNILNMISKAELPNSVRENLIHLVKRIDDVANAANASARILISMNHNDFLNLDKEVHVDMLEMARYSVDAVKKLNLMVKNLVNAEEDKIHKIGEEVSILEHKCDEKRYMINNRLVHSVIPSINPFSAIVIHNCIFALEAISDNAEEVADYIIMLMVTRRK